jgi:hypothetical protein
MDSSFLPGKRDLECFFLLLLILLSLFYYFEGEKVSEVQQNNLSSFKHLYVWIFNEQDLDRVYALSCHSPVN